jgi:uncharacterized protein (DUF58 family)
MRSTRRPDPTDAPATIDGRLRLTPEGLVWVAVVLLLGGVGWYKNLNLVLLLTYLMAGLLLLNGVMARAHARRVIAERDPPPPVFAGEEAVLRVVVHNFGTRPATVVVTDTTAGLSTTWLFDATPPGVLSESTTRRVFPRRGVFPRPPITVGSGFPFGFLKYEKAAGPAGEQVVLPRAGTADPDGLRRWVLRRAGGDGRSRKVLRRVTTDQADVRGVRPYRSGDSIRSVHWRSSARRGDLMVREYDAAPAPDLVLVVEPWLPDAPTGADRDRLEAALSLAATVVLTWCRGFGTRVTVGVAGEDGEVRSGPPTETFARAALVPLAAAVGSPSPAAPAPAVPGRSLAASARVVVSSRPDSPLTAKLTRATGKPFVALDPSLDMPWYQPPADRPQPG